MNKLLLGTAAAALMIAPAAAGPIAVTVGGYYNTIAYSVDSDNVGKDYKDISLQEDAEIIFKGKGKLNNGLTIGFQVQLEAHSTNNKVSTSTAVNAANEEVTVVTGVGDDDQIDEHYVYVKGDFGKIELGAENSAAYKTQVTAPKFLGWKTYDNNFATWSKVAKYEKPLHDNYSGDANKINYYSPRFNGVQFVYSLTPSAANSSGAGMDLLEEGEGYDDVTAMGVNYKGKIGGMKVKASFTTEEGEGTDGIDDTETAIGLSVSSGPWTIGGHIFEAEENNVDVWDITTLGVQYKLNEKTSIGVVMHDQTDDSTASGNNDTTVMVLGGSTKLGAGTKLTYSYETVESDDPAKGDSTFMGVGLLLKF